MRLPTRQWISAAAVVLLSCAHRLQGQMVPMPVPPGPGGRADFPPSMETPAMPTGGMPLQPQDGAAANPPQEGTPDSGRKRDPFWPVGYVPRKPVLAATQASASAAGTTQARFESERLRPPDWDAARKLLDIRGVSLIGRDKQTNAPKFVAMVGGKFVEEGDSVSVAFDYRIYRWKISGINANGISLVKTDVRPE